MVTSSRQMWDERYASADAVWSTTPNVWVEQLTSTLAPGRVLDLGAGEGRNLTEGVGGPQDAAVLYHAEDVAHDLEGSGLAALRLEQARRTVQTDSGGVDAIDALAVFRRH